MCRRLQQQTLTHTLLSPIQHGGLPRNQCANHICHLKSLYAPSKSSYRLYIGFKKPSNSVSLSALRTVLEYSNLSRAALTVQKPLRVPCGSSNTQQALSRLLCPGLWPPPRLSSVSPSFYHILKLSVLLLLGHYPCPEQGRITSHLAFIDDILFHSEDPSYIKRAISSFDGPARLWGLDMNVQKTEIQGLGQAVQRMFITVVGSSFHTLGPKISRPRTHYLRPGKLHPVLRMERAEKDRFTTGQKDYSYGCLMNRFLRVVK